MTEKIEVKDVEEDGKPKQARDMVEFAWQQLNETRKEVTDQLIATRNEVTELKIKVALLERQVQENVVRGQSKRWIVSLGFASLTGIVALYYLIRGLLG